MGYATEAKSLAESLMRLYGNDGTLTMTGRYAADSAASGDAQQAKWGAAAAWIAELIKTEEQLGKPKNPYRPGGAKQDAYARASAGASGTGTWVALGRQAGLAAKE